MKTKPLKFVDFTATRYYYYLGDYLTRLLPNRNSLVHHAIKMRFLLCVERNNLYFHSD